MMGLAISDPVLAWIIVTFALVVLVALAWYPIQSWRSRKRMNEYWRDQQKH